MSSEKLKIGILGFFLESNRFSPVTTGEDFKKICYLTGDEIIEEVKRSVPHIKSEAVGFVKAMNSLAPWEPRPILFARTTPGGPIDHGFFIQTIEKMEEGLKRSGPLDGVYLADHGAMVSTESNDPEGTLYEMIRNTVGPNVPFVSTVDLHANISRRMFDNADLIISYRTNPHVDGGQRAEDAANFLLELIRGRKLVKALMPVPITPPSVTLLTGKGPYADLINAGQEEIGPDLSVCSVVGGFVFSDVPQCGIKILAFGTGTRPASVAEKLARMAWEKRERFQAVLTPVSQATAHALNAGQDPKIPSVCLADVADNPGGGGRGNTTGILEALLQANVQNCLLGLFFDPALAGACHQAGEGTVFEAEFNTMEESKFSHYLRREVRVLKLSNGKILGRRGVSAGSAINLGPTASIKVDGLTVAVSSNRIPCNDPACFEHLGIDVSAFSSLVIKSRGHFRAGFDEFFKDEQIIEVDADGLASPVLSRLDFVGLKRPTFPLEKGFSWDIPAAIVEG
jgi:microcystin degradation protein MlrC